MVQGFILKHMIFLQLSKNFQVFKAEKSAILALAESAKDSGNQSSMYHTNPQSIQITFDHLEVIKNISVSSQRILIRNQQRTFLGVRYSDRTLVLGQESCGATCVPNDQWNPIYTGKNTIVSNGFVFNYLLYTALIDLGKYPSETIFLEARSKLAHSFKIKSSASTIDVPE